MNNFTRRTLLAGGALAAVGATTLGWLASKPGGAIVTPGRSRARPVKSDEALPGEVDVVIIGGGYVGCCTALTLAERGVRVALCEKGVIAGEASGRSVGWVDSQFLDPVKMEMIARSKELWAGMNARIGADTGHRPLGLTSLLANDEAIAAAQGWLESVKGAPGVDARLVGSAEAARLQPGASGRWAGALYQPSDASVEPTMAAPAIAEAAQRAGAIVMQNCAVRGVERSAGRISGVITEKGPIKCQSVVLAGGYWSPLFARSLGIDLPQFGANASMSRVAGVKGPAVSAWGPGFCWRPQIDGSYTIAAITGATPITPALLGNLHRLGPAMKHMWGEVEPVFNWRTFWDEWRQPRQWALDKASPFESNRIYMPEVRDGLLDKVLRDLAGSYPVFEGAQTVERWGGTLITTPDNMPVLDAAPGIPGLFLGTSFYYGLTMGPAAGEALADLVTGASPKIDLKLYRQGRFADGSPIAFRF